MATAVVSDSGERETYLNAGYGLKSWCRTYLVIKLAGKGKFRGQQRQFLRFLVLVGSRCAVRGPTNRGGRNEKSVRHQSPQCGHGHQGASRALGSNAELGALKGNLRGAGLHPRLYVSR